MTWRKTAATALLALVVVLCMTGCPAKAPKTPVLTGPDSTWTGADYMCKATTTVSKGEIRYVINWTDATDTTASDSAYKSGDTAILHHIWDTVATYNVTAKAILDANPAKASDFSPAISVKVNLNQRPVVDSVLTPPVAVKDAPTVITVYGHDPDDDSLRAIVKWPGGDTTTERTLSPCAFTVTCIFTKVETADVHVQLQDWKGTKSRDTIIRIRVGLEGGVKWYWRNAEDGAMSLSALVANDGGDEVVMSNCWEDGKFYSIKVANGKVKGSTTTRVADQEFTGGPALCAGHVIVGSDEGELYALALSGLSHAWRWPGITNDTLESYVPFGAPAINGSDIYIGADNDSLYKFTDVGGSATPGPVYAPESTGVVDAPVVDADGNVYFGTDKGYLYKMDANLSSPWWRRRLIPAGEVSGPIIGSDGTVYCGADTGWGNPPTLYAINPDSTNKWPPVALDGVGARPALGQSALFVGTDGGTVYCLNPGDGSIIWQKSFAQGVSFVTTPIVAANGYVYFQSDDDVLYCLNQADGNQIWACDCNYYLPGGGRSGNSPRPRKLGVDIADPNPSITSTGDIIVVGQGALFCVAGYTAGPLDLNAAWPKWQKDPYNTGKR